MLLIYFIILFCVYWLLQDFKRPTRFPPGPKWWPLIGNLLLISKKVSALRFHHLVWKDMVKKYGPIVGLKLGKIKLVIVADKDLIKEVSLREEFEGRPDGFYWRMRAQGERLGIVFADGPHWSEQRKFSIIHIKNLGFGSSLMEDLINEEAINFVHWLKTVNKSPVNFSRIFTIPVLNILWAIIAGKRYKHDDENFLNVCEAMFRAFRDVDGSGGILQQLPILRFIIPKASGYESFLENHKIMWDFISKILEEHKKTIQPGINRDFVDAYLHEIETKNNENSMFTENELRITILDFLQAGGDTTSGTVEFAVLYLIRNLDIQKRLQKEIDDVIGTCRQPMFQDKSRMPYMSAFMMEVQRLANIAPVGVPHRTLSNTQLAGYQIPKNTTILLFLYNMHTDKNWEDPHTFKPERFLDIDGNLITNENHLPFGIGRRKCIGENMAKINIFLFIVHLLRNFQLLPANPDIVKGEVKLLNGITLSPEPFKVILKTR